MLMYQVTGVQNLSVDLNTSIGLTNEILADIGYDGLNSTVYYDLINLMDSIANITGYGNLTGMNYVQLSEGANVRALPMMPSNTSIEAVMAPLDGVYYRVDYFDRNASTWLTYNPSDPFSNTLFTMETGKAYTIWVSEDSVLFIS